MDSKQEGVFRYQIRRQAYVSAMVIFRPGVRYLNRQMVTVAAIGAVMFSGSVWGVYKGVKFIGSSAVPTSASEK